MTLPSGMVTAVYQDTGIPSYHGNPLIEALPPIPDRKQLIAGLSETMELRPTEIYLDGQTESYRLQHSSLAAQAKIKSRERKPKDFQGAEGDEPF